MSAPLADEVAIVTGASSGIGAATARALAREGADVALAARREDRLAKLAEEVREAHGVQALAVPSDVTDREAVDALVETTVDELGRLDVLVNNAGLARGAEVATMEDEAYETMMDTNCDGMFYATRAALPHLQDAEGLAVFVGSAAGKAPRGYNPVYAATKWWTRGFAKSVSAQAGDDVAVTIVNPAAVRTEFEIDGEAFQDRFAPGEVVEPEEVADAIAYAAQQDPSMVHEIDVYERDKLVDA
ncbi:short-chain dehydrogenase [Thermoplasmatales archaeon SW_10_69_26]|nr:MAG: short-chain dehydrogenase [Thermoplasmatales archaeon SW_10_69_26]